jgi:ribosomal protein L11 methyltransferase
MHYLLQILKSRLEGKAKGWLKAHGLNHLYILEEHSATKIGGFGEIKDPLPSFLKLIKITDETINWEEQWQQKIVTIPIGDQSFLLEYGPGFGDASHPTTLLCLFFLEKLKPKQLIDLGSGSGILSIAALVLGANEVIGIEIDEEAILHHKKNLFLNHLPSMMIAKSLDEISSKLDSPAIVINMILMEQKELLSQVKNPLPKKTTWIASGFLESERSKAMNFYFELGLHVVEEKFQDGWGAFLLKN